MSSVFEVQGYTTSSNEACLYIGQLEDDVFVANSA